MDATTYPVQVVSFKDYGSSPGLRLKGPKGRTIWIMEVHLRHCRDAWGKVLAALDTRAAEQGRLSRVDVFHPGDAPVMVQLTLTEMKEAAFAAEASRAWVRGARRG